MSVVYDPKFHVGGDLSRPLTKAGNEKVLAELRAGDPVVRTCIAKTEEFLAWRKDFQNFSGMSEEEKNSFVRCLKFWFSMLKESMKRHRIGKGSFRYGVSWNEITKFVYQF